MLPNDQVVSFQPLTTSLKCLPFTSSARRLPSIHTARVTAAPEPLDLVLFNDSSDAQGAHLGVWMSPDQILHLCPEVGVPAVWTPETFRAATRYSKVVGAKRCSPSTVLTR